MSTTEFVEYLHHPATADLAEALLALLARRQDRTVVGPRSTRPRATRVAS